MSIVSKDRQAYVDVDIQPEQMQSLRAVLRDMKHELNLSEKVQLACVITLTIAASTALLVFAYTLAKQANVL
jgi:hypothetical protein